MMNNEPKVSIIIPTYKRPEMIERAIESSLNQTYKNIEVIVVDDNIPDSFERNTTKKIISKYLKNNKFKYLEMEKNSGGPAARNAGIKVSTGEYINFLDDDDYFTLNKIEIQLKKFEENNDLGVVGCYGVVEDENGNIKRYERGKIKGDVFKKELINNICSLPFALIKREIIEQVGGFENVISSQEHVLFIKLFNANPNYDYVPEVLTIINHHSGSRISNNPNRVNGKLQLYEHIEKYFSQLTKKEIRKIRVHHYINISTIYAMNGKRKKAFEYWKKSFKVNNLVINFKIFKGLAAFMFGSSYERIVSKILLLFDFKK